MVGIIRATLGDITAEVALLCGDRLEKAAATAGAASTITFGNVPVLASATLDNKYNNRFLYIFKGTSAGDHRIIDDYAGLTRIATVATAFTATPTATSEFIVTERRRTKNYEDAVIAAIRRAAYVFPRPITDTSRRVGNILHNGAFQFWDTAVGTTNAAGVYIYTGMGPSTGWVVRGTGALGSKEDIITPSLDPFTLFSGELVSDGVNEAFFEWVVPDWYRYAGKTLTIKGRAYASIAGRINFRVLDGVNTYATNTGGTTGTHTATAGWEELSHTALVISAAATQLVVECRISAGSAVTARFGDVRVYENSLFDLNVQVPPWLDYVERVYQETGDTGRYHNEAFRKDDYLQGYRSDGWKYLWFDKNPSQTLTLDRRLMLVGPGYRTDTIAVTTNVEHSPQLITDLAVKLVLALRRNAEEESAYTTASERVKEFEDLERRMKLMRGHAT